MSFLRIILLIIRTNYQRRDKMQNLKKKHKNNNNHINVLFKIWQDFRNLSSKGTLKRKMELRNNQDSRNHFKNSCLLGTFYHRKIKY